MGEAQKDLLLTLNDKYIIYHFIFKWIIKKIGHEHILQFSNFKTLVHNSYRSPVAILLVLEGSIIPISKVY
jgi:hypothetical protein